MKKLTKYGTHFDSFNFILNLDVETNGDSKEVKQPKARPDRVLPYEDWKEQILKKANALISQGGYD